VKARVSPLSWMTTFISRHLVVEVNDGQQNFSTILAYETVAYQRHKQCRSTNQREGVRIKSSATLCRIDWFFVTCPKLFLSLMPSLPLFHGRCPSHFFLFSQLLFTFLD
jgi:hypothetical protein